MKANLYIRVLLFIYCDIGFAQNTIQKRVYLPKSSNAWSYDIKEATTNNFILIGISDDTLNNQIERRLTLAGVSSSGNLLWRKSYGNNKFKYNPFPYAPGMLTRNKNFLYCATSVRDSNNYAPGVFIKFDLNGDTLWQKKFYEPITTEVWFSSVCPSVDNGFYIIGHLIENSPGYNGHAVKCMYLLKTDRNGNKLWDKKIYKSNLDKVIEGDDVVQDSASKKLIIISIQDYDIGGSGSSILIYDSLGNKIRQRNGFVDKGFIKVIQLRDGNFVACGTDDYNMPLINGNTTGRSLIVKFDSASVILWSRSMDTISISSAFSRVFEDRNKNIITGGGLDITAKYTNGVNEVCRLAKIDESSNLLWKKYFDNITDIFNSDRLSGMCYTSNEQIAFTSYAVSNQSPLTFMFYLTDTSYCDINAIGCYSYSTVGINKQSGLENEFSIHPNPTEGKLTIQKQSFGFCAIQLQNSLGQIILNQKLVEEKTVIDLTEFPEGIYFLKVENESGVLVKKVIKE